MLWGFFQKRKKAGKQGYERADMHNCGRDNLGIPNDLTLKYKTHRAPS